MGPMLWQLPPTFRRDDERLAAALADLPPGRHCFEFRHESWFRDEVYELLREHGVALVIGDRPQVHAFQTHELTTDWTFVRFHGGTRGARGNYARERAARVGGAGRGVARRGRRRVRVLQQRLGGLAPRNAASLRAKVEQREQQLV